MRQHIFPPTPPQQSPVKQSRFAMPDWLMWTITWLGIIVLLVLYIFSGSRKTPQPQTPEGKEPARPANATSVPESINGEQTNPSVSLETSLEFNDPIVVDFGEKIEFVVSAQNVGGTINAKLLKPDGSEIGIPPQPLTAQIGDNSIVFELPQVDNHYLVGDFKLSVELDGKEIHRKVRVLPPAVKVASITPYLTDGANFLIIPTISKIQLSSELPLLASIKIRTSLSNNDPQIPAVDFNAGQKSVDLTVAVSDPFAVQQAETRDVIFDNVWAVETNSPVTVNLRTLVLSAPRENGVFEKSFTATVDNTTLTLFDNLKCGIIADKKNPFLWLYQFPDGDNNLSVLQGYLRKDFSKGVINQWFIQPFTPTSSINLNTYYVPRDPDPTKKIDSRLEGPCTFQRNPDRVSLYTPILTTDKYVQQEQLGQILIVGRLK